MLDQLRPYLVKKRLEVAEASTFAFTTGGFLSWSSVVDLPKRRSLGL
jgi:hypothetical protein